MIGARIVSGELDETDINNWVEKSCLASNRSTERNLDILTKPVSTEMLVVVKEFTLNRCPFQ